MRLSRTHTGPSHQRKLFIGGLPADTDQTMLEEYYKQWGTVIDSIVICDPATKQSRGFGFVTFAKVRVRALTCSHAFVFVQVTEASGASNNTRLG